MSAAECLGCGSHNAVLRGTPFGYTTLCRRCYALLKRAARRELTTFADCGIVGSQPPTTGRRGSYGLSRPEQPLVDGPARPPFKGEL